MKWSRPLIALLVLAVVGAAWLVMTGADHDRVDGGAAETSAERSTRTRQRGRKPGDPVIEGNEEPAAAPDDDSALRGRVLTGRDRTPVPGARVAVFPVRPASGAERVLLEYGEFRTAGAGFPDAPAASATVTADGRFALDVPEAESYHVLATAQGLAPCAAYHEPGDGELRLILVPERDVRIRIVDLFGAPVAGAAIHRMAEDWTAPLAEVLHTDEYGRAALRLGEREEVVVRAAGFAPLTWRPEEFSAAERVFTLEAGRSLRGRVVDGDGRPVPDAIVRLSQAQDVPPQITDAAGEFRFDRSLSMIVSSFPEVEVSAGGFHPGRGAPDEAGGMVLVRLLRPVRMTGQVRDADGRPVAAADITWESGRRSLHAQADAAGRFALRMAQRATGTLRAVVLRDDPALGHPVRWSGASEVALADADVQVDLVLERSSHAYLSLRVLAPDGTPLEDVGISVIAPAGTTGPRAHTNAAGHALVVLFEPSEPRYHVYLRVDDPFTQPEERFVPVSATADGPVTELVVRTATRITLVFAGDDGVPIDGDSWLRQHPGGLSRDLRLEDGALVRVLYLRAPRRVSGAIAGVGRYSVEVDPVAAPGGRMTIPIGRGASISGTVTVEGGGVPEGFVSVSVVPPGDADGADIDLPIGADGRFEFTGLPGGTYSFMVLTTNSTILAMRTGTLERGQNLDLGQVSADPSEWVTVTFLDVAGKPAVGADVEYLYSPAWQSLGWEVANERGEVRGPPAPGSRLVLRVDAGERGVAMVPAADDFPNRRIRLLPPAVLNVRVEGTEEFEPRVDVHVRLSGLDEWIEHDNVEWPDENDGVTRVLALAPCDVRVRIGYRDGEGKQWRAEGDVTVTAGRTRDLTLTPERVESSD